MAGRAQLGPVGAYPVKHHLECPEITRKDVSYPVDLRTPDPDAVTERKQAGIHFEAVKVDELMAALRRRRWNVVNLHVGDVVDNVEANLRGKDPKRTAVSIVAVGDRRQTRKAVEAATEQVLNLGVRIVTGGRLVRNGRIGEFDLLVRDDGDGLTYRSVDYKDHRSFDGTAKARPFGTSPELAPWTATVDRDFVGTPKLNDSMQLVHYWHILNDAGFAGDRVGGIVGRESVVVWRDLDAKLYEYGRKSAFDMYDFAWDDFQTERTHESRRAAGENLPQRAHPEWKGMCKECPWRDVCREELEEANHITLLADMTPLRAKPYYQAGISTVGALARLDYRTAAVIDAGVDVAAVLVAASTLPPETPVGQFTKTKQASALHAAGCVTAADVKSLCTKTARLSGLKPWRAAQLIDQARVARVERVHRARGVDAVGIPRSAIECDIDIEDDGGGICYLIGVRETYRTRGQINSRYIPFVTWDNTDEAEAANFAAFFAYVFDTIDKARKDKAGAVKFFYYTDHETRYFMHLAHKHAGFPGVPTVADVETFLASDAWFDMRPVLGGQLIWPTPDRTLKSLAKYVKFFWRDEAPGGANSVAWYREATATDDPVRADELRERILAYNEDDVEATWVLREWVSRLGEARRPGTKLPGVEQLDRRFGKRTVRAAAGSTDSAA
jgi:predicted RecB family nuclease